MQRYQITYNSKIAMITQTYDAESIGDAIDQAIDAELEYDEDGPIHLEIYMLGEKCQKS